MNHIASIICTLVTITKLAFGVNESLHRNGRSERRTLIWISLLSFIMIKSALIASLALLGLPSIYRLLLYLFNLCIRLTFLIVYIAWISFVFKWMIEAFECWVSFFAFETQWASCFIERQWWWCDTAGALTLTLGCAYIRNWIVLIWSDCCGVWCKFAIIRGVLVLVWGSPVVLQLVCINTWHEVMPQILLRTVGCFIAIHIKCVLIQCFLKNF